MIFFPVIFSRGYDDLVRNRRLHFCNSTESPFHFLCIISVQSIFVKRKRKKKNCSQVGKCINF